MPRTETGHVKVKTVTMQQEPRTRINTDEIKSSTEATKPGFVPCGPPPSPRRGPGARESRKFRLCQQRAWGYFERGPHSSSESTWSPTRALKQGSTWQSVMRGGRTKGVKVSVFFKKILLHTTLLVPEREDVMQVYKTYLAVKQQSAKDRQINEF